MHPAVHETSGECPQVDVSGLSPRGARFAVPECPKVVVSALSGFGLRPRESGRTFQLKWGLAGDDATRPDYCCGGLATA